MRLFHWPPMVDRDAGDIRLAPIHLAATLAGAALLLAWLALAMAVAP